MQYFLYVSVKTGSTPASLSFKGQATKHTTVKWTILETGLVPYQGVTIQQWHHLKWFFINRYYTFRQGDWLKFKKKRFFPVICFPSYNKAVSPHHQRHTYYNILSCFLKIGSNFDLSLIRAVNVYWQPAIALQVKISQQNEESKLFLFITRTSSSIWNPPLN